MIQKKVKLLSFGLCLSLIAPILVYAEPVSNPLDSSEVPYFNYEMKALGDTSSFDHVSTENTPKAALFDTEVSEEEEQRTVLDYFPDTNFALAVAKCLGKSLSKPVTLEQLSTIVRLDIFNCDVTSIEGIEYLTNLEYFRASCNMISELPDSFAELVNLKYFDISYNQLSTLPDNFGQLVNLQNFNVGVNYLFSELPDSFGQLVNLQDLKIDCTSISVLPDSFGDLSSLRTLSLNQNKFTVLPDSFGNLSNLQELFIIFTPLTELPDSFGQLSNLTNLCLKFNKLSKLPDSFGQLSNLKYLTFYGNQLTELPDSIGQLSNLINLDLNSNKLSKLPDSIGSLSNLTSLDVVKNQLTELPDSIGGLSNLRKLDVALNHLTEFPDSIEQLSELSTFSFYKNELTSELPIAMLNRIYSVWAFDQSASLDTISTQPSEINYENFLSPLILQTKENNNGILTGIWKIEIPVGKIITLPGGDGSEINTSLFSMPGKYIITFEWTSKEPYPNYASYYNLNFKSRIIMVVE